jgi:hypothetical protein
LLLARFQSVAPRRGRFQRFEHQHFRAFGVGAAFINEVSRLLVLVV